MIICSYYKILTKNFINKIVDTTTVIRIIDPNALVFMNVIVSFFIFSEVIWYYITPTMGIGLDY